MAGGKAEHTGRRGSLPLILASDGKHVACRAGYVYILESWVRVVSLTKGYPSRVVGICRHVDSIEATDDGGIYFEVRYQNLDSAGWKFNPHTGEEKEIWKFDHAKGVLTGTKPRPEPEPPVSVTTDYRYVTTVTDRRTGKVLKIDNSARYEAEWMSASFGPGGKLGHEPKGAVAARASPAAPPAEGGTGPRWVPGPAVALASLAAALLALSLRAMRQAARTSRPAP